MSSSTPPTPQQSTTTTTTTEQKSTQSLFSLYKTTGIDSTLGFMFCGGVSGTVSRTCAAPFERLKILFQVQDLGFGNNNVTAEAAQGMKYNGIVSGTYSQCIV